MSSNSASINYRILVSQLIEVSKPSIIYLLDFVAISALLIAYLDTNYVTDPANLSLRTIEGFTIVIGLVFAY